MTVEMPSTLAIENPLYPGKVFPMRLADARRIEWTRNLDREGDEIEFGSFVAECSVGEALLVRGISARLDGIRRPEWRDRASKSEILVSIDHEPVCEERLGRLLADGTRLFAPGIASLFRAYGAQNGAERGRFLGYMLAPGARLEAHLLDPPARRGRSLTVAFELGRYEMA